MATGLFNLKQVNQAISQGAWSGYIAPKWVEYLVVAGGGGAAINRGGGGGAGGLLTGIVTVAAGTSYTVTVGAGGAAKSVDGQGNNGVASVFGSISTTGGGGGGNNTGSIGTAGGSGGGSGNSGTTYGGAGVAGQGNAGGGGVYAGSNYGGGGGGGAGTVGGNGTGTLPGNGGSGIALDISGSRTAYAGGGGGAGYAVPGAGGAGGGGSGSTGSNGGNGAANTGGGGGASTNGPCGGGGSGIVVVRYPGNVQFFTGGTVNYNNGYIIHIFTSSGTLAPTTPTPYNTSYQISRSLRFNSADSTYLTRTPASASNQRTWTWSGWVKRSALGTNQVLFGTLNSTSLFIYWDTGNGLSITDDAGSAISLSTTPLYRDPSAWYHVVFALDTTQATASNRAKLYINGTQVTAFATSTYPTQNATFAINAASAQQIGCRGTGTNLFLDGYMTEVNFIDGSQLTPSSFGATSTTTGVWAPIQYTGTYGTNGFYLNFSDNSNTTAATLGKDYSGNGNNWTPNNFSVTAGAGNDSLVDSPTSYGTDTGVGGTVRGNYATLNAVNKGSVTLTNGNLDATATGNTGISYSTIGMSSGKWYWEVTCVSGAYMVGIGKDGGLYDFRVSNGYGYFYFNGQKYNNNSGTSYGATFTTGDVIGVGLDMDAGTLTFYKNGTSQGTAFSGLTGTWFANTQDGSGGGTAYNYNFGQRPFAYTAPSGFKALCTQNLPTPAIGASSNNLATQYFNPVLWTGDSTNPRTITGVGFQPDLVWVKRRDAGGSNFLQDAVRGVTSTDSRTLVSNTTDAETNYYTLNGGVTAFTSDGFTTSGGSTNLNINASGSTFVAWNWKANGAGATNTAGSITSTVSANTTSGFSVVTFTAPAGATAAYSVGHGLPTTPSLIIIKARSAAYNWWTWHIGLGITTSSYMALNLSTGYNTSAGFWGTFGQTSTVFGLTNGTSTIANDTMVAYCFSEVAGFSKFGTYTGNASTDGPFIYCGFRPAYVMARRIDGADEWNTFDNQRNGYNVRNDPLYANLSNAEGSGFNYLDLLSNGFKMRNNSYINNSGTTYIFIAFAQNPFKYSIAR